MSVKMCVGGPGASCREEKKFRAKSVSPASPRFIDHGCDCQPSRMQSPMTGNSCVACRVKTWSSSPCSCWPLSRLFTRHPRLSAIKRFSEFSTGRCGYGVVGTEDDCTGCGGGGSHGNSCSSSGNGGSRNQMKIVKGQRGRLI